MEYIDIIDKNGNRVGEVRPKNEVHENGLWHRTVHTWCINSNKEILLQKRSKNKQNFPNMWDISAAGHISAGEESIHAALREIKEEIGIDIDPNKLEFLGSVKQEIILNDGTYFDNEIQDVYLTKIDFNLTQLNMQKEEVSKLQWVPISEFYKWVKDKKLDLISHPEEYELLFKKLK